MSETSKEDVLNFVADLAAPVGPEVFTGFGSEIQNRLAKDPMCFDGLVQTWLKKVSLLDLEPILLEIAGDVDIPEGFTNIRSKFEKEWEFVLTTLIYEAFSVNNSKFQNIISKLEEFEGTESIVAELKLWKKENVSDFPHPR